MSILDTIKARIRGTRTLADLERCGFTHGVNLSIQEGCIIDPGHCMLISVGDNVTLAPRVHILAHDASTKMFIGVTKIAEVRIGSDVFIGAGSIILPGVCIGDRTIVGAGSVVTKSLPAGGVYAGSPAHKICDLAQYLDKEESGLQALGHYDRRFTVQNADRKMLAQLARMVHGNGGRGYIE